MSAAATDDRAPRERVLELPHLRLAARVWGRAGERPTLALHGWLDNAASFDGLAPRVPGLELVALDLPGHGRSDHRPGGVYHFIDYVADAIAACDALGWERFSIIGHSLGAGVGALVAGAVPDRVERLVLLEGLGPMTNLEEDAPAVLRHAVEQARARARKTAGRERPRPLASVRDAVRARLMAGEMQVASATTLVERALREDDDGLRWRSDPRLRLASRVRLTEGQTLAFLRAIRCPTLLVRAHDGLRFDEQLARQRVESLASLELVRLPGGHHVHLDDPEPVAAAVRSFLTNNP
ncbi:MAG: alpha/beta hydrolase [Myxococcales bacterium]|nr:alpha/beta hydrolase [Myxococcales bacterium]MCB9752021.1 alpha/beta hydrolase [Myxococcales bacterium]